MRIVSLVPSLTETVVKLGFESNLVGITGFCVHPPGLHRHTTNVGGTKDPDLTSISQLNPTHILTNTEENRPEDIVACTEIASTFECFPRDCISGINMIAELGEFLGNKAAGKQLSDQARFLYDAISAKSKNNSTDSHKAAYLVWQNPYMAASTDTYISEMLALMGCDNIIDSALGRYPEITLAQLLDLGLEKLFLSTEPFPFRQRDADRIRQEGFQFQSIDRIDGRLMSWYGAAQIEALQSILYYVEGRLPAASFIKPL